jgi:uncharacterized protein (TIGR00730 family)
MQFINTLYFFAFYFLFLYLSGSFLHKDYGCSMDIKKVCVYCASSNQTDQSYLDAATDLGKILAQNNISIVYGGGGAGSMGRVANGALENGGKVYGVIPKFMIDLEWGHKGITELKIVDTMHERKHEMIQGTDAVIALPGGSGTLEELLEVITWKRLGIYSKPIIIVNLNGFYNPLLQQFENCIKGNFMSELHGRIWSVVSQPEEVIDAIKNADEWPDDARSYAALI